MTRPQQRSAVAALDSDGDKLLFRNCRHLLSHPALSQCLSINLYEIAVGVLDLSAVGFKNIAAIRARRAPGRLRGEAFSANLYGRTATILAIRRSCAPIPNAKATAYAFYSVLALSRR